MLDQRDNRSGTLFRGKGEGLQPSAAEDAEGHTAKASSIGVSQQA